MKHRVLLAVDLSYQSYRACAAHRMLSSGRTFTGGLYGFLTAVTKIIRETKATHMVVGQDRKPYKRSETYPQYKQLRKKSADNELADLHSESMPLILEMLNICGIPVWGIDGFEYDDLAGFCVHKYRHRFDEIWAASNDSDLYQWLWCPRFKVYRKDLSNVMTSQVLLKETGLTPEQFMLASALQGTHNDIEGIKGVGEKTAAKAVLDRFLFARYLSNHGELIERNLGLIKLPHPSFPFETELPKNTHIFRAQPLYRFAARYDIEVTASMVSAMEQLQGD